MHVEMKTDGGGWGEVLAGEENGVPDDLGVAGWLMGVGAN